MTWNLTLREKVMAALILLVVGFSVYLHIKGLAAERAANRSAAAAADAIQQAAVSEGKRQELVLKSQALADAASTWKAQYQAAKNLADKRAQDLKVIQAKLAALPAQPPATNPTTLPDEPVALCAAFTAEGFPPANQDGRISFGLDLARPMLGFIHDGKLYPQALERIAVLNDEVTVMGDQTAALSLAANAANARAETMSSAYNASKEAEEVCVAETKHLQQAVQETEAQVRAKDKELSAEKPKKWIWGGVGTALGWIVKMLL